MVAFFLSIHFSSSEIFFIPLLNVHITPKIFSLRSSIYCVSTRHRVEFSISFLVSLPVSSRNAHTCFLVSCLHCWFSSHRFVTLLRLFTRCDVDPESAMNISLISLLTFSLSHTSDSPPKNLVMDYVSNHICLLIYFFFAIFIYSTSTFLCDLFYDSMNILSRTYSWDNILQSSDHFYCNTYITFFLYSYGNTIE